MSTAGVSGERWASCSSPRLWAAAGHTPRLHEAAHTRSTSRPRVRRVTELLQDLADGASAASNRDHPREGATRDDGATGRSPSRSPRRSGESRGAAGSGTPLPHRLVDGLGGWALDRRRRGAGRGRAGPRRHRQLRGAGGLRGPRRSAGLRAGGLPGSGCLAFGATGRGGLRGGRLRSGPGLSELWLSGLWLRPSGLRLGRRRGGRWRRLRTALALGAARCLPGLAVTGLGPAGLAHRVRVVVEIGQRAEQLARLKQPAGELVADLPDGLRLGLRLRDHLRGAGLGLGDPALRGVRGDALALLLDPGGLGTPGALGDLEVLLDL